MANPIRRLVQLVIDKAAAARLGRDAKGALGGVEGALERLKSLAKTVGGAIAAAFAVGKILEFGRAAVEEANRGEREWSKLANTLRAVGEDADGMRASIEASAAAFQSATVYGAGDYLTALDRMIALTGDVTASTNNMGLVANVAAQFFDGELGPATDLVAKAMNGNVAALQKMGITAEDAQGALEVLAERSMGAAEARAATFSGRVQILTELYNDFLDSVGRTILDSEGAGEAMNFLTAAVRWLTDWVQTNADTLRGWVTRAVRFAIDAADVLLRVTLSLVDLFRGGFSTSIGMAAVGVSYLARAYALAYEAAAKFLGLIGAKDTAADLRETAAAMREGADAIEAWGKAAIGAGGERVAGGLDRLGRPLFSSGDFSNLPRGEGAARPSLSVNAPQMGANAKGEDEEDVERLATQADKLNAVLEGFGEATRRARVNADLMGEGMIALEDEAKILEAAIAQLIADGFDASDPVLGMMRDRLKQVRGEMELLEKATEAERLAMEGQAAAAGELASALGAAMGGGLGPFAKQKAKQNLLEAAELAIRATLATLTGFGAPRAAAFAAGAAKHAAIAAAWGALAGTAGSGAMPGAAGSVGLSASATNGAARSAQPIGADVKIYLQGAGFHALNPEVQKVVRGAYEQSTERQGNARVRVITGGE